MIRDEELNAAYEEIDRLRSGFRALRETVSGDRFDPLDFVEHVTEVTEEMLDDKVAA